MKDKEKTIIVNTPEGLEVVKTIKHLNDSIEAKIEELTKIGDDFVKEVREAITKEYQKLLMMYGLPIDGHFDIDPTYLKDHNVAFLAKVHCGDGLSKMMEMIRGKKDLH